MRLGLGHMGITPAAFWRYSLIEWLAALDGYSVKNGGAERVEPFTSTDLVALMESYPDDDRNTP